MILVDTSVWIDFLRGTDSQHRHVLHRLIEDEEDICITEIVLTEILQGIKADRDFQRILNYISEVPIYSPKSTETYIMAATIYRNCRKKGKTVQKTIDCIIAAISMENGLILLHNDKDFDHIEACTDLKCVKIIKREI